MLLDMVYKGLTREKGVAPGGGLRLFYAYHTQTFSSRNSGTLAPTLGFLAFLAYSILFDVFCVLPVDTGSFLWYNILIKYIVRFHTL